MCIYSVRLAASMATRMTTASDGEWWMRLRNNRYLYRKGGGEIEVAGRAIENVVTGSPRKQTLQLTLLCVVAV